MTQMDTDLNERDGAPNSDLTKVVIGAAMKVLNTLRPELEMKRISN
jgi:hypothetical protein